MDNSQLRAQLLGRNRLSNAEQYDAELDGRVLYSRAAPFPQRAPTWPIHKSSLKKDIEG